MNKLMPISFLFISFVISLSASFSAHGKIVKYDVYGSNKFQYTFREVCLHFKAPTTLIESLSVQSIECMGQKFSIQKFCRDKYKKDHEYARSYIVKKDIYLFDYFIVFVY